MRSEESAKLQAWMTTGISRSTVKRKQTKLETADQMFKDAFTIKKARLSHLNPNLTAQELQKLTAEYFKKLNMKKIK